MISPILIDFQQHFPMDWNIDINSIDLKGFSYIITANCYRRIYRLKFDWVAIDKEETLQIKYFNNIQTPNMTLENKTEKIRINFD
jgi:hypothetical protein